MMVVGIRVVVLVVLSVLVMGKVVFGMLTIMMEEEV